MPYQAEYIWIDGTEAVAARAKQDEDRRRRQGARHLGLRRLQHEPGDRATTPTACCSPVFVCKDPLRGPNDKLVMCEVLSPT